MNQWTIYHNPKCSKSRETLAILEKHKITPHIVKYLETPLSFNELKEVLKKLKLKAREIVRTKEEDFKNIKVDWENEEEVLKAIIKYPKLLERQVYLMLQLTSLMPYTHTILMVKYILTTRFLYLAKPKHRMQFDISGPVSEQHNLQQ